MVCFRRRWPITSKAFHQKSLLEIFQDILESCSHFELGNLVSFFSAAGQEMRALIFKEPGCSADHFFCQLKLIEMDDPCPAGVDWLRRI